LEPRALVEFTLARLFVLALDIPTASTIGDFMGIRFMGTPFMGIRGLLPITQIQDFILITAIHLRILLTPITIQPRVISIPTASISRAKLTGWKTK
jgi:hypothetical protein